MNAENRPPIAGSYSLSRDDRACMMNLEPTGEYSLTVRGREMVKGRYEVIGREVLFSDRCRQVGGSRTAGEGRYLCDFDETWLTFTMLDDAYDERAEALCRTWRRTA